MASWRRPTHHGVYPRLTSEAELIVNGVQSNGSSLALDLTKTSAIDVIRTYQLGDYQAAC
jgi:hypothetical protein